MTAATIQCLRIDWLLSAREQPPAVLQSIQLCRGVAALFVVLFHLGGALASAKYFNESAFIYLVAAGGSLGVSFFFVLSGFIITIVHWRDIGNPAQLPAYLYKRCVRIYPIYWIVFFVVSASTLAVPGSANRFPSDFLSLLKAAALVPQDPSLVGGTGAPVVIVAWSLQYELLFYIFFGLLILSRLLACVVTVLAVALIAGGHILNLELPLAFLNPAYFMLFGAGLLTGLTVRANRWRSGARFAATLGGLGIIAAAPVVTLTDATQPVLYGALASLLIFGLVSLERQRPKRLWKGARLLGDSSYVLYLIHFPIISAICKAAVAEGLAGFGGAAVTWVVSLSACFAAAILLHIFIERPLMNAARGLWRGV